MSERTDVTVQENAGESRYDASTDTGVVAGFTEYQDAGDVRVFTHTEVDEAFEGAGVGTALARGALDDVRERGLSLQSRCRFISSYIERHPEYADLQV